LYKVKLFAQPRGCLRDWLQITDMSMSLTWGMSKRQVCECWKQKNATPSLQHLSKSRRLFAVFQFHCIRVTDLWNLKPASGICISAWRPSSVSVDT